MANINSLTTSSSYSQSSIYGNRNVLTGLASGMDTESMIENSISGYKTKINTLLQQQTQITWKQDAFRSIIDKLSALSMKYTSYTSNTNLSSNSFFNNSVVTTAQGKNAAMVSATGKTNSDIRINSIDQLATATRYSVDASSLNKQGLDAAQAIDWVGGKSTSNISGSFTLKYNDKTFDISFGTNEIYKDAASLANAINTKLAESEYGGVKGGDLIQATAVNGEIKFTDKGGGSTNPYISSVSGALANNTAVSITTAQKIEDIGKSSFKVVNPSRLSSAVDATDYLSNKSISVTLDGVTKKIDLGSFAVYKLTDQQKKDLNADTELQNKTAERDALQERINNGETLSDDEKNKLKELNTRIDEIQGAKDAVNRLNQKLQDNINAGLRNAFGSKVTASVTDGKLSFSLNNSAGSTLKIESDVADSLFGSGIKNLSNNLDVGQSLGQVVGTEWVAGSNGRSYVGLKGLTAASAVGAVSYKGDGVWRDAKGNQVVNIAGSGEADKWVRTDGEGNLMYEMKVNGVTTGVYSADSALDSLTNAMSSNSEAGVNVVYSKLTDKFTITADKTGADYDIDFGTDEHSLAYKLFGNGTKTVGTDAVAHVTVNGDEMVLTRSSNVIDMDGLTVTLKGTFEASSEPGNDITFETKADTDKITDAIKAFVEEYNAAMKEIHDAYKTQPAYKNSTKHTRYMPLTEEDKANMSESAIKTYEEKAKQGLLFGDSNLSALYNRMLSAITPSGADRKAMEAIGLTTSYSNGVTTLTLDEEKLRSALEGDPDKVRDVFAKSKEGGSSSDGLMATMKRTLDAYASTSSANPGILVRMAGTTLSSASLLNNELQTRVDNLDTQISKWTDKMSSKIDYYTNMYTQLEKLISQMNSQSSVLAGLMGY